MGLFTIKKYKTIKDENGNKKEVFKTKEEWNKETKNGTAIHYFSDRYEVNEKKYQFTSGVFELKRIAAEQERIFLNDPIDYILKYGKRSKKNLIEILKKSNDYRFIDNQENAKVLDDYYNDFFEYDCTMNKDSTAYDHRIKYYKHISPILGRDIPGNIDFHRIDYFHEEINKKKISYSSKVNINSSLVKFFEYLRIKGIIEHNYAKMYGGFKKENEEIIEIEKDIKYQTLEEFEYFMSNIKDIYWKAFFNFLFWHGLRKGEQQALRWSDIDFTNNVVKINKSISKSKSGGSKLSNTKNKKNRVILLAPQSVDVLKDWYNLSSHFNNFNDNWFVFGHGEDLKDIIARNTIDRHIKGFYKELYLTDKSKSIKVLTHHEFGRHSHASYLLNKGMGRLDIYDVIALRLGDTPEVIRATYAHPYENLNNDKTNELLKL